MASLKKRFLLWLRYKSIEWESRTAGWVLPSGTYMLIDANTRDSRQEARKCIREAAKYWGTIDPEVRRANSTLVFLDPSGKGAL